MIDGIRTWLLSAADDGEGDPLLSVVAEAMGETPHRLKRTARGPIRRRLAGDPGFVHTPSTLMRSWETARYLEHEVGPGDAVFASDAGGMVGVFALEQRVRPAQERVRVVVVAGASATLGAMLATGSHRGVPDSPEFDWELVCYRFADAVVTPSARAVELLADLGITAHLLPLAPTPSRGPEGPVRKVLVPERLGRRSQTGAILRAMTGLAPDSKVHLTGDDDEDAIWSGTTWDAVSAIRDAVPGEVLREPTTAADVIVLGDPFAYPAAEVRRLVAEGVPVVVPRASTAAAVWPGAATWGDEDELADLLREGSPIDLPSTDDRAGVPMPTVPDVFDRQPVRASRVSVGVPIFRDVRFVDDCISSIIAQDQRPHEVLIVDDGSGSPEVEAVLGDWEQRHPDLIQVLRQPNRGVCVARNLALDHMTGDAFVFVDQDDVLEPSFLSTCAAVLRSDPDLIAVATWTRFFGAYEGIEAKPPFDARVGRRENPIVSTCVLVDMAARAAGVRFVPELAWVYCEDWDMWAQIVAAGGRFGLVPRALVRHRVHPASGGHRRTELAHELGKAHATARLRDRAVPRPLSGA